MKSLLVLFTALSATLVATASTTLRDFLSPAMSGTATVYFRVVLEKRNGVDMRENYLPKDIIAAVEKQGASVRPIRLPVNVGYWIFFKNGDFASVDVVNNIPMTNLPYAKLGEFFADAPHNGPKWHVEGDTLVIGQRYYSVRVLPANDATTGGRKGEVEIAVLDGKDKIYYYFGSFVAK